MTTPELIDPQVHDGAPGLSRATARGGGARATCLERTTTLQNARKQYWLTVVYPSICDMLARAAESADREALGAATTAVTAGSPQTRTARA